MATTESPKMLLNLKRQTLHPATHVGVARRDPHPHPARHRDHRSLRTFRTRRSASASTSLSTRTRFPEPSSISMTPGLTHRPLVAGRDGLAASDRGRGAIASISTGSKIEPSLPGGLRRTRKPTPREEQALSHAVPPGDFAHHGPRRQRLFDDPSLLVLAPAPAALDPENLPIHLCVTLRLALRSHPSRTRSPRARRPPRTVTSAGVVASLLYRWRRQFAAERATTAFVPVRVFPEMHEAAAATAPICAPPPPAPSCSITVAFGEQVRLTIEGAPNSATLANVIGALSARDRWR